MVVSDKQLHLQYMDMDAAIRHCTKGIGDLGLGPVMTRVANPMWYWPRPATFPRKKRSRQSRYSALTFPDLKVRYINVVDLFKLQSKH